MASAQTATVPVDVRIFRLAPNGRDLDEIPHAVWQQIVQRERPLQPANGSIKVLVLQLHSEHFANTCKQPASTCKQPASTCKQPASTCKQIDALRLQTDEFGFLLTWDATAIQTNIKAAARLVDARYLFLQRFIAHRHSWRPDPRLLTRVLALATRESTTG